MDDLLPRLDEIEKQAKSAKFIIDFVKLVENHFPKLLAACRVLAKENETLRAEKRERAERGGATFLEPAVRESPAVSSSKVVHLEAVAKAARKQGHSASNHRYTPDFLWDNCEICEALYTLDTQEPERPRGRVLVDIKPPATPRPRGGM